MSKSVQGRPDLAARLMRRLVPSLSTYAVVVIALTFLLGPIAWMASTSLKPSADIWNFPPEWIPTPATLENYVQVIRQGSFDFMLYNSVKITTLSVVGQLFCSTLAGYAFARLRFPGREKLFIVLLATLIVPEQVTMIPLFVLMRTLGWLDTHEALYVPTFFGGLQGALNIFLMRQFFRTLSQELLDAARVDGCSPLQEFLYVALPSSKPALTAIAVINVLRYWNDLLSPAIFLNTWGKLTLPIGLTMYKNIHLTQYQLIMAGALLSVLPILVLYMATQRYFIRGIAFGAGIKG